MRWDGEFRVGNLNRGFVTLHSHNSIAKSLTSISIALLPLFNKTWAYVLFLLIFPKMRHNAKG
jgi:hypothetical protein